MDGFLSDILWMFIQSSSNPITQHIKAFTPTRQGEQTNASRRFNRWVKAYKAAMKMKLRLSNTYAIQGLGRASRSPVTSNG